MSRGDVLRLGDLAVDRAARSYALAAGHPRLDWRPRHDPRSRLFGVADVIDAGTWEERIWAPAVRVLDQGRDGACVGFACAQLVNAAGPGVDHDPQRPPLDEGDALDWYRVAQGLDQYPGNSYVGTSGLGGMKAGADRGFWTEYLWSFSVEEFAAAVTTLGPSLLCIPWHAGMSTIGPRDPLTISGPRIGGHALTALGAVRHPVFGDSLVVETSYGPKWGDNGCAHLPFEVAATLVAQHGEMVTPTGRPASAPAWSDR